MNVMIQMEIKARELEARGLLALVAAERGHEVLLGDVRPYLTSRMQDFPPGLFHDKSLTPSRSKRALFERLEGHGSLLTSQDEEHWLNLADFDVPAVRRFSDETLGRAACAFAWGEYERSALVAHYPEHADRVLATGSPRVDLWRPELRPFHVEAPLPGVTDGRPFVLFASNFGLVLEVNRFWVRIRDKRQHFVGQDDDYEFERYDAIADKMRVLKDFVRTIRHLSATRPELLIVVRPHPLDVDGAWEDLLGPLPNLLISRQRSLNAWIRRATAVVQNGCTTGWEASVAETPLIAFHPGGVFADSPVNGLGRRASTIEEFDEQLSAILEESGGRPVRAPDAEELLRRRLAIDADRLAADRIVDVWEELPAPDAPPMDIGRIVRGRRILKARRAAGALKRLVLDPTTALGRADGPRQPAFLTAHKFPPFTQQEVDAVTGGLTRTLGRFEHITARVVAPDLIRLSRT